MKQIVLNPFNNDNREKIVVPPVKIQGIKTKLIPFIKNNIDFNNSATWYEPFMGSGVVGFNLAPKNAEFSDINPYIIDFYNSLKNKKITPNIVRSYLEEEGEKLSQTPADKNSYYYDVRRRFNKQHDPLDFLFLQRSNFNGMMRFSKNGYNVPFGRKPNRFKPALITKIVNQVEKTQDLILYNNWNFKSISWKEAISNVKSNSFIYLDPPYIGRNTDYYSSWEYSDALELVNFFNDHRDLHFALSMWYKNKYRENNYIKLWRGKVYTNEHFYFVGGKEKNRNPMIEALVVG